MYDICHPTYYHMSQLGCNDQVKLTTAFYVYMELCEVKRYWDVEYKYLEALELFYLEAKKSKNGILNTFIPWPAFLNITLDFINNIQQKLKKDKFTFVFKEGDTTSVYYNISSGIVRPIAPEKTIELKKKEEKKFELEKEINRNTANLYERALLFDNDITTDINQINSTLKKEESDTDVFFTPKTSFEEKETLKPYNYKTDQKTEFTEIANNHNFNSENINNISENEESKHIKCKKLSESLENSDIQQEF